MAVKFTCCECGRDLCLLTADEAPGCRICSMCTFVPGWFRDPDVRSVIDPDHDGVEVLDRETPFVFGRTE